ncbi:MAG: RNA methyltransferase [Candidatus Competibacteraceae bacterium]|nr:RNA methyltransferase [Candidatus Competibacteraceae bacterium]
MSISLAKLKQLRQLAQNKFREQHQLFIAEGSKTISDLCRFGYKLVELYAIEENGMLEKAQSISSSVVSIDSKEMERISQLQTPPGILGIFHLPEISSTDQPDTLEWSLILDGIRDPGNMGTLLRAAHWFGCMHIYLCNSCVNIFNPKVVQASMGSLAALQIKNISSTTAFLHHAIEKGHTLYATDMKGEPLSTEKKLKPGIIILGSESHGISSVWEHSAIQTLSIPSFGNTSPESLNVAVAAGIIMFHARISEGL